MSKKSPKNFSCIRIRPVQGWEFGIFGAKDLPGKKTGLAGYLAHDFRFMLTPNAEKNLTKANLIFCKKTKWTGFKATHDNLRKIGIKNEFSIPKRAQKILRRLKVQVQENSVVATALMLTVSPELLRNGEISNEVNGEILQKYVKGTMRFLRQRFGNRLLLACLHMDELNPHISAYILPLIKKEMKKSGRSKNGEKGKERKIRTETRLGHTVMFTRNKLIYEKTPGTEIEVLKEIIPGTCSILQDEYASVLQKEGLDVIRGVRAEPGIQRLSYVTAKRQYERMMRGVKNAEEALAKFKKMKPEEQEEMLRQSIALATEADRYRNQRNNYQMLAAEKDKNLAELKKKLSDSMRELSVAEVIEAITGISPTHPSSNESSIVRHGSDKGKSLKIDCEFILPSGQRIGVESARNSFQNLTPDIPFSGEGEGRITGSGSINAVMYLTGCTYDSAVGRLANLFGDGAIQKAVIKKMDEELAHKKNTLLIQDDARWPELLVKLKAMKIDDEVISQAKSEKSIAASHEGNILFMKQAWDENSEKITTNMLVVDPSFPGVALMETGKDDIFMLKGNDIHFSEQNMHRIELDSIICATPLDAMAIKSDEKYRNANVLAISHDPGRFCHDAIESLAEKCPNRLYFADNLQTYGKRIAEWLAEHFGETIQKIPLPNNFRSWFEVHTAPKPKPSPSVEDPTNPSKGETKQDTPNVE